MKPLLVPLAALALLVPAAAPARAQALGDGEACAAGTGPAIEARIVGLKDRKGRLKLELYPGTQGDFLRDDRELVAQGKPFRRIWADVPASGDVVMCIKAPAPGRYGLFFTHDRDGKNKFNFWVDGGGVPSNRRIGRDKPPLAAALVDVQGGITRVSIRAQYLRSIFSGLGPLPER